MRRRVTNTPQPLHAVCVRQSTRKLRMLSFLHVLLNIPTSALGLYFKAKERERDECTTHSITYYHTALQSHVHIPVVVPAPTTIENNTEEELILGTQLTCRGTKTTTMVYLNYSSVSVPPPYPSCGELWVRRGRRRGGAGAVREWSGSITICP